MGSVKRQQVNDYRGKAEWAYVTFTETRTIAQLIRNRSKFDESYLPKMFYNGVI